MKKYIYIDTKIKGAILQLISYFQNGVFDKEFIVIFKLYKENKHFLKLLKQNNIKYITFSFYRQFPNVENSIIFYLFNAQSNCRIVAYREAKHIFVTHGESNKLPSIKPILRIYDYVSVAGQAGIERLLEHKIFNKCDLENNKIIKMGNTFIGNLKYNYDISSNTMLYAPTWEGGLKEENYSSITNKIDSFKLLVKYAKQNNIHTIILQPHPNTGHRDKRYLYYLYKGIKYLFKKNIKVLIKPINSSLFKFIFFRFKNYFIENKSYNVKIAFCDVSAIEVQLLDKNIPYYIFFNNAKKSIPNNSLLKSYYKQIGIYNFKLNYFDNKDLYQKIKFYYISYENIRLYDKSYREKINWLIKFINNEQKNPNN